MADQTSLTTWTPAAKIAGIGVALVAVVGLAVAARGAGRCGRLQRDYARAVAAEGARGYTPIGLRIDASRRGCAWARAIEASEEQDRYLRAKGVMP